MSNSKWLTDQIKEHVSMSDIRALSISSFTVKKAYLESDIVWNNLGTN